MKSSYRHWQDLRLSRMLIGLLAAPIFGILVALLGVFLLGEVPLPPSLLIAASLTAELWSVVGGLLWLYTIVRSRGGLGLKGSITMGVVCAVILAIAALFIGILAVDTTPSWIDAFLGLLAALPTLVAGAAGGWIFWRISVRPLIVTSEVFD
jgi:drug/metabolite transporter (DMT)-like permease